MVVVEAVVSSGVEERRDEKTSVFICHPMTLQVAGVTTVGDPVQGRGSRRRAVSSDRQWNGSREPDVPSLRLDDFATLDTCTFQCDQTIETL